MNFIVQNLPLPSGARGRPPIYPWDRLKVGQSFVVPKERVSIGCMKQMCRDRSKSRPGIKFRCTKLADGNIQVWREK